MHYSAKRVGVLKYKPRYKIKQDGEGNNEKGAVGDLVHFSVLIHFPSRLIAHAAIKDFLCSSP